MSGGNRCIHVRRYIAMGYVSVLLLLGATLVYVNADQYFGQTKSGTIDLVKRETRLYQSTTVKFNVNRDYDVIIDAVTIEFASGGASCRKNGGGPSDSWMQILISPTRSYANGLRTTVIVKGRWNRGKRGTIDSSAITFS